MMGSYFSSFTLLGFDKIKTIRNRKHIEVENTDTQFADAYHNRHGGPTALEIE